MAASPINAIFTTTLLALVPSWEAEENDSSFDMEMTTQHTEENEPQKSEPEFFQISG